MPNKKSATNIDSFRLNASWLMVETTVEVKIVDDQRELPFGLEGIVGRHKPKGKYVELKVIRSGEKEELTDLVLNDLNRLIDGLQKAKNFLAKTE